MLSRATDTEVANCDLTTELPATGWKKVASDSRCIYQT